MVKENQLVNGELVKVSLRLRVFSGTVGWPLDTRCFPSRSLHLSPRLLIVCCRWSLTAMAVCK